MIDISSHSVDDEVELVQLASRMSCRARLRTTEKNSVIRVLGGDAILIERKWLKLRSW
jgi:hypothetical protein